MKKTICFCLLFSFISAAFGNSIKFHLVDAELELPLEGVRVVLKGNTSIKTESDENGDAELLFPDGFKNGTAKNRNPLKKRYRKWDFRLIGREK